MDIKDFNKVFAERMKEVQEFVASDDVKDILGVEAVNHFKESFTNEGFTDSSLEKWQDVKRRNANSSWHGHPPLARICNPRGCSNGLVAKSLVVTI